MLSACDQSADQPIAAAANPSPTDDPFATTEPPLAVQLAGDALIAPPEPELQVTATLGYLNLTWEPLEAQQLSNVYQYDTFTREEELIEQFNDNTTQTLSIPSRTHLRAWHREQFRVELCTNNNCVSSQRIGITTLASNTIQSLSPAVFIEAERFAENAVINADASLLVAALPVEGALQLYIKPADQWLTSQRVRLGGLEVDRERQLQLALSNNGDTVAVAINSNNNTEVRIVERLGESWIETARWNHNVPFNSSDATELTQPPVSPEHSLALSADGDELLIATSGELYSYQRDDIGWSQYQRFDQGGFTTSSASDESLSISSDTAATVAFDISDSMDRIFTLDTTDTGLWISVWQKTTDAMDTAVWRRIHGMNLLDLDPTRQLIVKSNSEGSLIAIAAWELATGLADTPVLWRYSVPEGMSVIAESLTATDSLRIAPVQQAEASLRFDADNTLNNIVIGWQGPVDSTSASDASLLTYRYNDNTSRWISQLELPATISTLAKQAFAGLVRLSGNAQNLIIVSTAGQSLSGNNRVGEILSLH